MSAAQQASRCSTEMRATQAGCSATRTRRVGATTAPPSARARARRRLTANRRSSRRASTRAEARARAPRLFDEARCRRPVSRPAALSSCNGRPKRRHFAHLHSATLAAARRLGSLMNLVCSSRRVDAANLRLQSAIFNAISAPDCRQHLVAVETRRFAVSRWASAGCAARPPPSAPTAAALARLAVLKLAATARLSRQAGPRA